MPLGSEGNMPLGFLIFLTLSRKKHLAHRRKSSRAEGLRKYLAFEATIAFSFPIRFSFKVVVNISMMPCVLSSRHPLEGRQSIVERVSVAVMDNVLYRESTPDHAFHDEAVLQLVRSASQTDQVVSLR